MPTANKSIVWFKEVDKDDNALVGDNGANLGEIVKAGFPVPPGFIVTTNAYYSFLKQNSLLQKIKDLLESANFNHVDSLTQTSLHIKKMILKGEFNEQFIDELFTTYIQLGGKYKDLFVTIRPATTTAQHQNTSSTIRGESNLLKKVKEGWASLFDPQAIAYRYEQKLDHLKIGIALIVQKMVESELSGNIFTIDPATNDKTKLIIEAIRGLGELMTQNIVTPDRYEIDKKSMSITLKHFGNQQILLKKIGTKNKTIKIPKNIATKQKLTENQILKLALLGKQLEKKYYFPQVVEWAIDKKNIYVVQTHAITTLNEKGTKEQTGTAILTIVASGSAASPGIATGPVKIIYKLSDLSSVLPGDVLVTKQTNDECIPAIKKAAALITEEKSRTSPATLVAQKCGVPAIVSAENATKILRTGLVVTVHGTQGKIYKGSITPPSRTQNAAVVDKTKTATKLYITLSEPELAKKYAQENIDGVGLLSADSLIKQIGIHPKKALQDGKKLIYIKDLAARIEIVCKEFAPRPVMYQVSNLQTNEYRNLTGGHHFEPVEHNPLLGYHGAFRFVTDPAVFELELEAIKIVRNKKELKNLWLTIPFVRSVKELITIKQLVSKAGLYRSGTFKLWMTVQTPANALLLDKYLYAGVDGVSIDSTDLTQLLVGIDKTSEELSLVYNEQNEASLLLYKNIIHTAQKHKIPVSFYSQEVSQNPSLVEKLVQWGITSITVNPPDRDTTRIVIKETETKQIS